MQLQPEFPQARRLVAVRILMLEDDPAFAELVSRSLRRASADELALTHVASLAEAKARLAAESFDLVLTDLSLPDSKGLETLAALVGQGDRLICVLTGEQDAGLREAALALGAYDLLSKDRLEAETLDRLVRLAVMQARALATVRRSEGRLRAIVEAEPECVKLLDADARLIEMNPAGLRMIQAESLAAVRGHCMLDLVVQAHREAFAAITRRASRGEPGSLEFEVVGLQGERRWLETHAVPLRDGEPGQPALVLGITRDITARKNAEAAKARLDRTYEALAQANEAILKAKTETELFDRACEIAVEVGGFVLGTVLRLGPDGWLTRAGAKGKGASLQTPPPSVDPSRPEGRGLAGEACRTRRPVISNDFTADPRVEVFRQAIPYDVGAVAVFPLFAEGEVAGVFVLHHGAAGAFTPELTALLERVADNISFALTNFGRETERVRAEHVRDLEHAVTRCLAAAESAGSGIEAVLRTVCEAHAWTVGRLWRVDEAGGVLRFAGSWARSPAELAQSTAVSAGMTFAPGQGLAGRVWESGEPLWVADTSADNRVVRRRLAGGADARGVFLFPVKADGRTIGVITFSSPSVREPDARLLEAVRMIGAQVGLFVQRKSAEEIRRVEERLRGLEHSVARELSETKAPREALQAVLRAICETGGFDCGRYFHLDGASSAMRLREGWAADAQLAGFVAASRELRFLPGMGLVGLVWQTGKVLWSADATRDPRVAMQGLASGVGLQGTLVVPVSFEGRVIGVLSLATRRLFEADARLIETVQVTATLMGHYLHRKQREAALDRFRAALDGSADMVLLVDIRDGAKLVDFNETACYLLGYAREELLGRSSSLIVADLGEAELRATHAALLVRHGRTDLVVRTFRRKDGGTFEVEVLRKVVDSPEGPILVLNARDLTERRRIEERQAAHLRYQESTARLGQAALGRRDAAGLVADALQTLKESMGCSEVGYQDRLPEDWKRGYPSALAETVHGEGGERGVLFALSEQPDQFGPEEGRFLAATASVLSAGLLRIESEARLAFLAQFDGLTGLPNRALLRDRFSQLIVQARRHGSALGLLFIDLDDFKAVNDTLGHAGGDELLKEAAQRLLAAVRPGDTVARIAGDEFAVILGDLARAEDAALVAQKVIDRLSAPLAIGGQEAFVTASIGIAAFPADGEDAEALLAAADAAMYRAKQAGRNGYQFFTADINQRTRARAQLGAELRRAHERDEFALVYQAKYDLRSGAPCAAEALLRWRHPERGLVTPGEFIPVLEETGLIVPVGEWVLRRACADLQAWRAAGLRALPVAVNLSARQFRQQDLHSRLLEQVRASGADPRLIELEITESQLMHDPDHAQRVLRSLAEAGIRVAIDDFGTGYSSLSYLTRFPVSALKIDRSFVADVLDDHADAAIVRAIIDMAHTLGFLVVAEGVETQAQATLLRSLGCEQAQGYYFSRPVAEPEFRQLLAGAKPRQNPA